MSAPARRRVLTAFAFVLGLLVVLRWLGVLEVPGRWLVAGWAVDVVLGLFEIGVVLVTGRAFMRGARRGGALEGYDEWIQAEQRLGMPRPILALARLELRFYRWVVRLWRPP